MAKFSAWVKKHLRSKPSPQKQVQPKAQLPFLPQQRRPITPASLDTPTCLLFKLPYDIRSIILLMAFGDRTLHADIVLQDNSWQWRGAVCYRNMYNRLPCPRYTWCGPWNDPCLQWVYAREGTFPEGYNVGIMGFLQSCRQAYREGIDVLYSANCINMQSEQLLLHLPQLIPPSCLACITSLEVVVTAHRIEHGSTGATFVLNHLKPILDNIVAHCGRLRSLCLSFMVNTRIYEIHDGPALALVDAFYRSMRLRDMRLELPTRNYARLDVCDPESLADQPARAPFLRLLWRSLDGEVPEVQRRAIQRYPYPPPKLLMSEGEDGGVESAGYWICEGEEGLLDNRAVCF